MIISTFRLTKDVPRIKMANDTTLLLGIITRNVKVQFRFYFILNTFYLISIAVLNGFKSLKLIKKLSYVVIFLNNLTTPCDFPYDVGTLISTKIIYTEMTQK